jgi:membrane protease YdiL (CAAX protease family)
MRDNTAMAYPLRLRFTPPVRIKRWRFWVGTLAIIFAWAVVGTILSLVAIPFTGVDPIALFVEGDLFGAFPGWGFMLFALVSFIPLLVGTILSYRFILGRPTKQLFAVNVPFRMRRVWWGFFSWLLVMLGPSIALLFVFPADNGYEWNFQAAAFIPFAIITLLLIPVQTTAEEVFFRGWLMQWFSQRFSSIWILSALSGIAFALPHMANPEALSQPVLAFVTYASVGFVLGWVTVRDRSLEIAIGAHAAHNLFLSLVAGYEGGALPAEALFVTDSAELGIGNIVFTAVLIPVFIVVSRWGHQKRPPAGKRTPVPATPDPATITP